MSEQSNTERPVCPTCGAPAVKVRVRDDPYADWGCSMEHDVWRFDPEAVIRARDDEILKALRALDAQAITSARFVEWVREASRLERTKPCP